MNRFIFFLPLLVSIFGCSWFHPKGTRYLESQRYLVPFVETGKIVDSKRVKEGGKLYIAPFKAGANVEADDQLDKISLMIVKGILDTLKNEGKSFEILSPDDASKADLTIEGHVTNIADPSTMRRYVLHNHQKILSVEGKMIDLSNGKTIAIFTDTQKTAQKGEDHKYLGLLVGQDIARFLLNRG